MTGEIRSVEECIVELFDHLGIEQAHIAAGRLVRGDWHGLATKHPERIASLTLISPQMLDPGELAGLAARMLAVVGDRGPTAEGTAKLLADLPNAASHILRSYEYLPWSDIASERGAEISTAMLDFLDRFKQGKSVTATLPMQQGEVAGISYRIRGAGPPLVLMSSGVWRCLSAYSPRGARHWARISRRELVCDRSVWILTMMQSCASAGELRAAGPFFQSASVPCSNTASRHLGSSIRQSAEKPAS